MKNEVMAVLWKEWREIFQQRTARGGLLNWLIMVVLLGVIVPLQAGKAWVESPVVLLVWSWPPLLAVMWLVADSFAGERERHTLETLLASRLPDHSILLGKILIALLYGWSIEITALALSLITINITNPGQGFLAFPVEWMGAILVISLFAILLVCSLGALNSLHASSVRSAYQRMSLVFIAIVVLPNVILSVLPDEQTQAVQGMLAGFQPGLGSLVVVGLVLAAVDAVVIWIALQRFQRARLVLD